MLTAKGIYDANVIVPLTKVNKKSTIIIITFLEEESITNEIEMIKDVRENYFRLSKSFDSGESLDDEYAKELMSVYNATFPHI